MQKRFEQGPEQNLLKPKTKVTKIMEIAFYYFAAPKARIDEEMQT